MLNLSLPSGNQRLEFNEFDSPVDQSAMDPIHGTVNLFYVIFNRKIIPLNPKNL
jgi:hypothetical protein